MPSNKKKQPWPLQGTAYVQSTFNNTIITLADMNGKTLTSISTGQLGFKGAKRGTSFAAQQVGQHLAHLALDRGLQSIHVQLKGVGPGKFTATKGLQSGGVQILTISTIPGIAHNGCRLPKKRKI